MENFDYKDADSKDRSDEENIYEYDENVENVEYDEEAELDMMFPDRHDPDFNDDDDGIGSFLG